jgi:hypothetical protein
MRVESVAESFDVAIEVVLIEDLVQPGMERLRGPPWQVVGRHPHRRLLRVSPSFPIDIGDSVVRGIDRVDH